MPTVPLNESEKEEEKKEETEKEKGKSSSRVKPKPASECLTCRLYFCVGVMNEEERRHIIFYCKLLFIHKTK